MTKREKSRIRIMHEAKRLYETYGIENVTFSQIAEEAGMCRTTIFNHFATAGDLMLALYRQEIEDIKAHCLATGQTGMPLIEALFDKLIEDTVCYPMLTSQLTNHAILSRDEEKPIQTIEDLVAQNLPSRFSGPAERERMAVLVLGAYYGLINHYHIYQKPFEEETLKEEFRQLLNILTGGTEHADEN